jgi:hypothetical protein
MDSEEGNAMGRGLLECTTEEGNPTFRLNFDDPVMAIFGRKF